MDELAVLTDRAEIESFLRRNVALNIYQLGDLDDFFWPHTTWYGLKSDGDLKSIALLYQPGDFPTLIILIDSDLVPARELIRRLIPKLPDRVYSHLSPGLSDLLAGEFVMESHGPHHKMILRQPELIPAAASRHSVQLTIKDEEEILAFYRASYPGNWFDARMLETGCYFGIRVDSQLVAVGGVHVYSPRYRVAPSATSASTSRRCLVSSSRVTNASLPRTAPRAPAAWLPARDTASLRPRPARPAVRPPQAAG